MKDGDRFSENKFSILAKATATAPAWITAYGNRTLRQWRIIPEFINLHGLTESSLLTIKRYSIVLRYFVLAHCVPRVFVY